MKKTTGDLTVELVEENKALKSQLADIKYLNADEVEHIIGSINTNQEKVQAICKLAIKVDREIDWQVIASGEIILDVDDVFISFPIIQGVEGLYSLGNINSSLFGKYMGKNIEIAIRVK